MEITVAWSVDVIDLATVDLPVVLTRHPDRAVDEYLARLDRADAFVVVTPEYNHSFPAPLKNAIDWAFRQWQAKPVAFVSYGGLAGGLRAVEQLRHLPYEDLGFARMDSHRALRQGFPEVIFCQGKTVPQVEAIARRILDRHQSLLATRMRTEDMLPIAAEMDEAGFYSVEIWGGATFDTALRRIS